LALVIGLAITVAGVSFGGLFLAKFLLARLRG
jgi:hypothetical protein